MSPSVPTPAVEFDSVSRSFGRRRPVYALKEVSVTLPSGSVTTLVGPNGAGKSTMLRLIAGTIGADEGRVAVFGERLPARLERVRGRIGILPGNATALYDRLTAREYLVYIGRLRGLSRAECAQRIGEVAACMGLDSFLDRRCGGFSTGMRQRTSLAATVLHRPALVLLDEPTTGLDIEVRVEVLAMIGALAADGTTLVVSTHHPEEVAEFSTHRLVLGEGRVVSHEALG